MGVWIKYFVVRPERRYNEASMLALITKAHAACITGGQNATNLIDCLDAGDGTPLKDIYTTPSMMVNLFVSLMFVAAGMLFFAWILLAGWKMISGKKKGFDEAKSLLTNAVIGLIVMVAAYWIVQFVNWLTGYQITVGTL